MTLHIHDGVWYQERGRWYAHRVKDYEETRDRKGRYRMNAIVFVCGHKGQPNSGDLVPANEVRKRRLCHFCKEGRKAPQLVSPRVAKMFGAVVKGYAEHLERKP